MVKVSYVDDLEKELLINEYKNKNLKLLEEQNITEGNFLIFGTEKDNSIVKPTELELLQQKLEQQDKIIEELMFDIIPKLLGGE